MLELMKTIFHYGGIVTCDPETKFQKYFYIFLQILPLTASSTFSILSILDLVMNVRTLPELAENCNLTIAGVLGYLKLIHISRNINLLKIILKEFENIQLNKFHSSLLNKLICIRLVMSQASLWFIIWNTVIVRSVPPFRVWLPFDMYGNHSIYWTSIIFLTIIFAIMCYILIVIGSISNVIMVFLCEYIAEVQNKFQDIQWSARERDDKLLDQLKDCIKYQQRLYNMAAKVQHIVGVTETFQFIGVTLEVSLAAFLILTDLSNGDYSGVLKYTVYSTTVLFLGSFSFYVSSHIIDMSSDISINIYKTDWYNWPNYIKRMYIFMIPRSQKPIKILIGGFIELSLKTYLNMLANCYSIFTLMLESI